MMSAVGTIVAGVLGVIGLPVWGGAIAERRGYSFFGWTLLGFTFVMFGSYLASLRHFPLGFALFLGGPITAFLLPKRDEASRRDGRGITLDMPLPPPAENKADINAEQDRSAIS